MPDALRQRPRVARHPEARATRPTRPGRCRRGFTLIEAMLTVVIVGVAVLAVIAAFTAFHQKNAWASRVATATYLANEIREMTYHLPRRDPVTGDDEWGPESNEPDPYTFDDLDDFDGDDGNGCVFTGDDPTLFEAMGYVEVWPQGPRNALRVPITGMTGWTQAIQVYSVDPNDIAFDPDNPTNVVFDGSSNTMAVVVTIWYRAPTETQPKVITRISWIAPN